MESLKKDKLKPKLNPWLFILFFMPIPVLLIGVLVFRWSGQRTNYAEQSKQLLKRQNSVLIYDATTLANEVTHLLENASGDVQTLSMVPISVSNFTKFYLSRVGYVTQIDPRDDSVGKIPLPLYSEIVHYNFRGIETMHLQNGKPTSGNYQKSCKQLVYCEARALEHALKLSEGEIYFGKMMKWYSPQESTEAPEPGFMPVYYRTADGILMLGIDYRYFKDLETFPAFPYEQKRDVLQSYSNGNYVYIVDSEYDMIIHPKVWHVTGIDRNKKERVKPMKIDADEGKHPLNIQKYQGEKLKLYFERLFKRSFLQKSADIFQATNLKGTNRVITVVPILLSIGQFQKSGLFGFVILGCSIDYFEEPKEQYVPYY